MTKTWATSAENSKKPRILLVDDEFDRIYPLIDGLEAKGLEVIPVILSRESEQEPEGRSRWLTLDDTVRHALNSANRIDAVVTDVYKPSENGEYPYGLDLVRELKTKGYNGPVVAHSSLPTPEMRAAMIEAGAEGLYNKRDADLVATAIKDALERQVQSKS